ncbi:MAG: RsmB/NOP family class I SAM-dependent RNA methyltransferase [Magnetococcales bacterium]|nr:RsmB/NOP family class I SAM-dependent RNA methyltransferase [Magnetococcales bacterium]
MTPEQAITLAAQPLEAILSGVAPADLELSRFFRQRGSGPRERALVGDLVFAVLRHHRRLAHRLACQAPTPKELLALAWSEQADWDATQLHDPLHASDTLLFPSPQETPPPVACSLPDWLWHSFVDQWGQEEALALGHALNQSAPTDLRVNRLRATREQVEATLARAGVFATPLPYAPDGLRLTGQPPVTTLEPFHQGLYEIQDEGSQLIPLLLAPRPGETVVDLCAGSGGKTLQLAALMGNRGCVHATDTDARRLSRLTPRYRRAGVRIIHTRVLRHEGDPVLRPLTGKADGVLVDAPCSGTGTLRRRPEVKWRLTAEQIMNFQQRQAALLSAGARLTRPGGRLVYATCSLLRQENEAVVDSFQRENPGFRLLPAAASLARQGVHGLNSASPFLSLAPHAAGCDGFFAALFQRSH